MLLSKNSINKVLIRYNAEINSQFLYKYKQATLTFKMSEEEKSKEDISKQTKAVEKLIKNIILYKLPEYKDKVYSVGGFVRDRLLGKNPKDLDLVVDDPKSKMESAKNFANKLVDILDIRSSNNPHTLKEAYGIYGVSLLNTKDRSFIYDGVDITGYVIELTPPREEGPYDINKRAPTYVKYTTLEDDSRRRDLTVNALYQNIITGEIKDFVGGLQDIKDKKLRPPEHPGGIKKIYEEDPLRVMRLIRFFGKLPGFKIDPKVIEIIKKFISDPESHKVITDKLSKERIKDELEKILVNPSSEKVVEGLNTMRDIGILKYLSPDLEKLFDVYHDTVYHKGESVWQHTMDVLSKTPPTLKARLAALFHDIGKLMTKTEDIDKQGRPRVHFKEHEKHSAAMVEKILKDLKFDSNLISSVKNIIHAHMGFKYLDEQQPKKQNKAIRVFIEKLYDDLEDAISLLKADESPATVGKVVELEGNIKKLLEEDKKKGLLVDKGQGYEYSLPISGNDLKDSYNLEGKAIGAVLTYLKRLLLEGKMGDPDVEKRKEDAKKLIDALMKDKNAFESLLKKYSEGKKSDDFFSVKKSSVSRVLLNYTK